MSYLPQYEPVSTTDDSVPASSTWDKTAPRASFDTDLEADTGLPVYPPPPPQPFASGSTNAAPRTTVTYSFEPRWPTNGTQADAVGIFGKTRGDAVDIVKRAFPDLREYPSDRIEFMVPVDVDPKNNRWAAIMEDAWSDLASNPPMKLRVQIADLPGDAKRRDRRTCIIITSIILSIPGIYLMIMLIVYLCGGFDTTTK